MPSLHSNKWLSNAWKTLVLLLVSVYLFYELGWNKDTNSLSPSFFLTEASMMQMLMFLCAGVGAVLNWGVEAWKWQILLEKEHPISFRRSFASVLSGITFGLLSPNRSGTPIGKTMHLSRSSKSRGIVLDIYGSYFQLMVTVIMGMIGLTYLFFIGGWKEIASFKQVILLLVGAFFLAFLVLLLGAKNKLLDRFSSKKNGFWKKVEHALDGLRENSARLNIKVFALSALRYFIFVGQFTLLLFFFGGELLFIFPFLISVVFLLTTLIPSFLMGELGVREAVAVFLIGPVLGAESSVFLASLTLWVINLGIPALMGGVFLFMTPARSGT